MMNLLLVERKLMMTFLLVEREKDDEFFISIEGKKATLEELSNNISERRCELKSNDPVSEGSERESGYIVGYDQWLE